MQAFWNVADDGLSARLFIQNLGILSMALSMMAYAILPPFYPLASDREPEFMIAGNGLVLRPRFWDVDVVYPWDSITDYYWRVRGSSETLYLRISEALGHRYSAPQLVPIELGPIDAETKHAIDGYLRQHIPPAETNPETI